MKYETALGPRIVLAMLLLLETIVGCAGCGITMRRSFPAWSYPPEVRKKCGDMAGIKCCKDCRYMDGRFSASLTGYLDVKAQDKTALQKEFSVDKGLDAIDKVKNHFYGYVMMDSFGGCYVNFYLVENSNDRDVTCEEFFNAVHEENKKCGNCLEWITLTD
jgi:hypothetical protein